MTDAQTIELADGRTLCFAHYGARDGRPVLYSHGAGSSRLEGAVYDAEARAAGVRIIAVDRPGCGQSSPKAHRSYTSNADDLCELADKLGIARFVVAGMSNGGAYTMAAALRLRDRVTAAIPINSSTPLHDPAARSVTPLVIQGSYALMRYAPRIGLRWAIRNMRKAEGPLRASIREALRQPDSPYLAQELALASHRWDFDHTAIAQPVDIFSGDRDGGYRYASVWAKQLPSGRLHVFAGGHGDFATPEAAKRIVAAMAAAGA